MQATQTALPGVFIIEPRRFADDRGHFFESFNARVFQDLTGASVDFVQDNHSWSKAGVIRGLHYQLPRPQGKLVRVVSGAVIDVAVDMRASSSTFGRSVAVELSAENRRQLWIPPGFAHGFQVLSPEGADFLYKTTDYWAADCEHCVRWDDPDVAIAWSSALPPIVSDKDQRGASFRDAVKFP